MSKNSKGSVPEWISVSDYLAERWETVTLLLQELVVGITTGAIYALIALGYTMVYGIIELINFAHGDVFMIGTLICVSIFGLFGITNSSVAPIGFSLIGVLLVTLLGAML